MKIIPQKDFDLKCDLFFTYLAMTNKNNTAKLITECFRKHRATDGRGVNLMYISNWEEFIQGREKPPRKFMTVKDLTHRIIGLRKEDQLKVIKEIVKYEPKKEVLAMVLCSFDSNDYRFYLKTLRPEDDPE